MSSSRDSAISIKNISKFFEIYEKPSHRLWQMLYHGRKRFYRPFWALQDISFEVKRGECVGIIGRNGAGKSTLLQIITGTLSPSSGTVECNGRVAALLELGSGFNPEFTGQENVYLNASILGLTKEEIDAKYDDIVAFADIGEFINQPVKSYSSGMAVRLAFAVVAHVDADILIVDEALSVGDAFFTQKCMRFLRQFMEKNTVLFVSHDTGAVNSLCNAAIMLENGRIKKIGTPKEITEQYLEDVCLSAQGQDPLAVEKTKQGVPETPHPEDFQDLRQVFINNTCLRNDIEVFRFNPDESSFGKRGATITNVALTDMQNRPWSWIIGGEMVKLRITCQAHQPLFRPIIGFYIKDRHGQNLFGDNTYLVYMDQPLSIDAGKTFVGEFVFRMPVLSSGDYSICPAVAEGTQQEHVQHHWIHDALIFKSHSTSCAAGIMGIPMTSITIKTVD